MKILIPTFSFPFLPGRNFDGKFVLAEARAYVENGAEVAVVTPGFVSAPREETLESGVRVYRFNYFFPVRWQRLKRPGKPLYSDLDWLARLQVPFLLLVMAGKILSHGRRVDIIHAQWSLAALLALPAKWLFRTRVVLTARGSDLRLLPAWLNRFIHRQVDAAIDCFGPQPWNEAYKRKFPARFITLPLIVYTKRTGPGMPEDMAVVLRQKENPFVIVYVGRFERLKIESNHLPLLTLIQAASTWKKNGMDFCLFYLGDGSLKREMQALIDELALGDRVALLGPKTDVMSYLRFADLGAGGIAFNAVSQEITMAGKPQLLVDCADNHDTPWVDGKNAVFIQPDDVADLETKVEWVMRNPEKLARIAVQAARDMEPYLTTMEAGGRLYLEKFTALLD